MKMKSLRVTPTHVVSFEIFDFYKVNSRGIEIVVKKF